MESRLIFARSMAVFWILVEVVCLVALIWGYNYLRGRRFSLARASVCMGIGMAAFAAVVFGAERIVSFFAGGSFVMSNFRLIAVEGVTWNFVCAVSIVLDGLLVLFFFRVCNLPKELNCCPALKGKKRRVDWPVVFIVAAPLAFWAFYSWNVVEYTMSPLYYGDYDVQWKLSIFFVKVSNLFFVALEGVGALKVWQVWRVLRKDEGLCA